MLLYSLSVQLWVFYIMNIKISLLKKNKLLWHNKKNMLSLKLVQNLLLFQKQKYFFFTYGFFVSIWISQSNGNSGLRRLPGLVNIPKKNDGKSPCYEWVNIHHGKSTISMAIFYVATSVSLPEGKSHIIP